jgi:negative regulator of flagellin synthesis FlgM
MINNDGKLGAIRSAAFSAVAAAKQTGAIAPAATPHTPPVSPNRLSLLAEAEAMAHQPPPIDGARVSQLRQAIAGGQYSINTLAIAEAILARASKQEQA